MENTLFHFSHDNDQATCKWGSGLRCFVPICLLGASFAVLVITVRWRAEHATPEVALRKPLVFGLSAGNYSYLKGVTCRNCASKLGFYCGYNATDATEPPTELLAPGRLGLRSNLSLWSQCFLWYANTWWSRATGGAGGLMFYKLGDVDDKSVLRDWLEEYEKEHGCEPFQVTPITLFLGDKNTCKEFYSNNRRWAYADNAVWFMKETKGSQGTHINLLSSRYVQAMGTARARVGGSSAQGETKVIAGRHLCPENGTVASLAVKPWLIDGYKFDNRVYVLVASITPLVVLLRPGHLRFSQVTYTEDDINPPPDSGPAEGDIEKDMRMGMFVTNPRFGLSHTNDTGKVLRPVTDMERALADVHGEEKASVMWSKLQV